MKKVVLFTMFACMCIAGFAQQMVTSTKNTVKLDNSAAVSFSQGSTYIYQITNTNLQIYKTEGFLKANILSAGNDRADFRVYGVTFDFFVYGRNLSNTAFFLCGFD